MTNAPVAPFPYFGGKRRVAPDVWQRFGEVKRYIEPFAGGAAVGLYGLRADLIRGQAIFNDIDGLLINAWRAIRTDPRGVYRAANRPIAEVELTAIHAAMRQREADLVTRLKADPDYCDATVAGWWVWGMCCSLAKDWAAEKRPNSVPLAGHYQGIVSLRSEGQAKTRLNHLRRVLSQASFFCGEWDRTVLNTIMFHHASPTNPTAIFLDPPYADGDTSVYGANTDQTLWADVQSWALAHGDDPRLRIALCGYDEHDALGSAGWVPLRWKANGGYGNQRRDGSNGNAHRETVWFSPHCRRPEEPTQLELFG